jgi:hypothetical protein
MRILSVNPVFQQRVAIIVPIVALLLSLFVVYPAWGRYKELQTTIQKQRKDLDDLRATPLPQVGPEAPTAEDRASEPPEFLGQVSRLAGAANCRLTSFDMIPAPSEKEVKPIRALRARVELKGQYYQIRDFLFRLAHAPRLFVVTDFSLSKETTGSSQASGGQPLFSNALNAKIEIERYVAAPAP